MDNRRGILLMIAAMAAFAGEDMFIKLAAAAIPTGQIILLVGLAGAIIFGLSAWSSGARLVSRDLLVRPVMLRNLSEIAGTVGFVSAITLTPLSSATAIAQALPLAITALAAVFLREPVGWRRWSAVAVGFAGVLMIVRPGLAGFQPASLFAVLAVVALAIRDLTTRLTPARVTTMQLSTWGFAMMAPAGLALLLVEGEAPLLPSPGNAALIVGALCFGVAGYYAITSAMRAGEISVVTPFRYTRLLFALFIGALVFGERPDIWTLAGSAIIIASGLYTIQREARLRRRARLDRPEPATPTASITRPGTSP